MTNELNLNSSGVKYLSFEPKDHSIRAICKDLVTKVCGPVTQELFAAIVNSTKTQASGWSQSFNIQLLSPCMTNLC
jgi:hypothetical protein